VAQANAIATCDSNVCVNACAPGVARLACPNTAPGKIVCGAWGFETNTPEGWIVGDPSDPAITAKTPQPLTAATIQRLGGSFSLVVSTSIPGGQDADGNLQQELTVQVPLCPDSSSVNLANRTFQVNAYFEYSSGTHLDSTNAKINAGSVSLNGSPVDSVGTSPFSVVEGKWLSGMSQVSISATHLTISFYVANLLAQPWVGRIYLDSLSLQ
jgi:hypothetical protein